MGQDVTALDTVSQALNASAHALQTTIQQRKAADVAHAKAIAEADATHQSFLDAEDKARGTFRANLAAYTALLADLDDENGLEVYVAPNADPLPVLEEEPEPELAPEPEAVVEDPPAEPPVEEAPATEVAEQAPAPQPDPAAESTSPATP